MFLCLLYIAFGACVVKIDFYEIPEEGLSLSVDDAHWFPQDLERLGKAESSLRLKRLGQRVVVTGRFSATAVFECDRCLGKFHLPLDSDFSINLELPTEGISEMEEKDHYCHDSEMDMDILENGEINITDILQQQLYLAVPMKKLCSAECRGMCSKCGANLNHEQCRCQPDTSSPFSVLAKLKG